MSSAWGGLGEVVPVDCQHGGCDGTGCACPCHDDERGDGDEEGSW